MLGDDLREALGHALPTDDASQAFAQRVLHHQLNWLLHEGLGQIDGAPAGTPVAAGAVGLPSPGKPRAPMVLDVGCGRGEGLDFVRGIAPTAHWLGVDIASSAEVEERPLRGDAEFRTFDGIHLPLGDATVDLAYSQQVFEHVTQPEPLLADIARVLRPGGIFCGSVSQLEAFHSRSVGGFTAYGWKLALERAGLHVLEVRPGVDLGTLLLRRVLHRSRRFDRYWVLESPGNRFLDLVARVRRLDVPQRNALKLMFAGQITFVAQAAWERPAPN